MGGRASKAKGARIEREIVALHEAAGIPAEKQPLSGALGGKYAGDVVVDGVFVTEVKCRANGEGFATLEKWLGSRDMLYLRKDRSEPLVLLPWRTYLVLMQARAELQRKEERGAVQGA